MTELYTDPETGQVISTHSMIKTFRRCPKQVEYKYLRRLKRKVVATPLKRGTWMHTLLEAYYKAKLAGEDEADAREAAWEMHRHLSLMFSKLFDEEKEEHGDLPDLCGRLFRSYLWHYKEDEWEVHDVEFTLETEFPDGALYRCRIDLLVEDQFGLWLVDHKTHKTLPRHDYRVLDSQSALYLWAALRNGIPVQGFIFNYLRAKAPTVPTAIKSGSRISRWDKLDTDYPTALRAIKELGFGTPTKIKPYMQKLKRLKTQRYAPGEPQTSPFFLRSPLEKSVPMIKKVALEGYHTHQRMHKYFPPPHPDAVERVPDRSCTFMCAYPDLCSAELIGGNTTAILKNFQEADPLDYYRDDKEEVDGD